MKRLWATLAAILVVAVTATAGAQNPCNPCAKKGQNPCNPCAKKAQNPCNPCAKKGQNPCNPCAGKVKGGKQTIIGYIGDSQCGLDHPMAMGDAKACTLKCVEAGGNFILADRANKVVYNIDKASQEKAREFAGQQVKVTGNVDAKTRTIKVTKIEAAA